VLGALPHGAGREGVKWTGRSIELFTLDQMKPEYLTLNPGGVVPMLVPNTDITSTLPRYG
jgi:hypothetical protein